MYAVAAAFTTYFCMYAFRKPFAVGLYAGDTFFGLALKDALIISQLLGYALSKWLGVKFISELQPQFRKLALISMIVFAQLCLVAFAFLPPGGRVVAMFFNGLPLGCVWGLIFGYLEGRRVSEILGAGLSCSYIVASGGVKSVGAWLMSLGVPELWMPMSVGFLFLPIFFAGTWALAQLPPPSKEDIAARMKRVVMNGAQRLAFVREFLLGLAALTLLYVFVTAYRDFRDNYAPEIWTELGLGDSVAIYSLSELPIAFVVMAGLALLYLVKRNDLGLLAAHLLMLGGTALIGIATLAWDAGILGGVPWMIVVGLGLYLAYVPYGCVLFDRMIAAMGVTATAVFMIYVTDASGYAGAIGVILYKHLGHADMSKLQFFRAFSYFVSVVATSAFTFSAWYFWRRSKSRSQAAALAS
ncbi:MAG: hypothetical protein A2289_01590 [Deltaproteobacteria bacterium RIFOXYA12_FULL_58_15]|nr:MAG: hypothetical protein A2289_01590 [Deltaproteobacteria bacterium RIFOXYA12_FULL_58_15]OGR12132.1 MAG: hypothetical protein A2341_10975 [Deltaproteobacteria bacterium RIFOXYB12_FULL_58_9]